MDNGVCLGKQSSQRVYIPYIFKRNTPLAETTIDTTPIDSEGNNKSHFEEILKPKVLLVVL